MSDVPAGNTLSVELCSECIAVFVCVTVKLVILFVESLNFLPSHILWVLVQKRPHNWPVMEEKSDYAALGGVHLVSACAMEGRCMAGTRHEW